MRNIVPDLWLRNPVKKVCKKFADCCIIKITQLADFYDKKKKKTNERGPKEHHSTAYQGIRHQGSRGYSGCTKIPVRRDNTGNARIRNGRASWVS